MNLPKVIYIIKSLLRIHPSESSLDGPMLFSSRLCCPGISMLSALTVRADSSLGCSRCLQFSVMLCAVNAVVCCPHPPRWDTIFPAAKRIEGRQLSAMSLSGNCFHLRRTTLSSVTGLPGRHPKYSNCQGPSSDPPFFPSPGHPSSMGSEDFVQTASQLGSSVHFYISFHRYWSPGHLNFLMWIPVTLISGSQLQSEILCLIRW